MEFFSLPLIILVLAIVFVTQAVKSYHNKAPGYSNDSANTIAPCSRV